MIRIHAKEDGARCASLYDGGGNEVLQFNSLEAVAEYQDQNRHVPVLVPPEPDATTRMLPAPKATKRR